MSIELKQAAQQALEALETEQALRHGYSYRAGVRIVSTADEAINLLRTALQQAKESEPVTVESVATVRRGKLSWLIEGGVAALPDGVVLLIADSQITDNSGSGEVYTHPAPGVPDGCVVVKRNVAESALQHVPYRGETWSALNSAMRPVQVTETELKVARDEFNNAIDFAIKEGIGAAVFLDAWRHGDTTEWPEFHGITAQAKKE